MKLKIRHMRRKGRAYYFETTPAMRELGVLSENLGNDKARAIARAEQLNNAWDLARREETIADKRTLSKVGTVNWLINRFQKSVVFYTSKSKKTKLEIDYAFKYISPIFGDIQAKYIKKKDCLAFYDKLRNEGASAHKSKKIMAWLCRLFSFAIIEDIISINPATRLNLESAGHREQIWAKAEVYKIIKASIKQGYYSLATIIQIAYDTAQRQQDILALRWEQIHENCLYIKQKKTGAKVYTPLSDTSIKMLNKYISKKQSFIFINERTNEHYNDSTFRHHFINMRELSGIRKELTFHDLRRTATTEYANSGATMAEITAISGHTINSPAIKIYAKPGREAAERAANKRNITKKSFQH